MIFNFLMQMMFIQPNLASSANQKKIDKIFQPATLSQLMKKYGIKNAISIINQTVVVVVLLCVKLRVVP